MGYEVEFGRLVSCEVLPHLRPVVGCCVLQSFRWTHKLAVSQGRDSLYGVFTGPRTSKSEGDVVDVLRRLLKY